MVLTQFDEGDVEILVEGDISESEDGEVHEGTVTHFT